MPKINLTFHAQGAVRIQAKHGCCLKGVFSYAGTAIEELIEGRMYESGNSPETVPRSKTPA